MAFSNFASLFTVAAALLQVTGASSRFPSSIEIKGESHNITECIERDIIIIGGGSTGTYSAIRLLDSGKSVVIVEKDYRLGGHTNTFTDPTTGLTNDYGVVVFHNTSTVRSYTSRLNVTMAAASTSSSGPQLYADFRTGVINSTFSYANYTSGFQKYVQQLSKYSYVETGFDLPDPVPSDLLLSFGDFAIKYDLGKDFLAYLFNYAQGLGDLLAHPTLYVFKNFGLGVIQGGTSGFIATAANDNSLIYEHATSIIGEQNILFNSNILHVQRSDNSTRVVVKTTNGVKLIEARKLVFTIPPKIQNLQGWDLSTSEQTLFKQFNNSGYYAAVVNNTGIPAYTSINNIGSNTTYGFAALPGAYSISPTRIPNLFDVHFASATSLSDDFVKSEILAEISRLQISNKTATTPDIVAYTRHTPFELWVGADAIEKGFYRDLYALQGQRGTWYTGAAFHTHDSSLLWEFTEGLIANITAS
ncbi:amine oxidase flavin-containing superfamily protein [Rutstroemia sp. NJR-2017a BVV2]|nr:amine oxidase flavin-containing superfamily protein [Rutstroemia sp. NJR-2017a BVV2]